RIPPRRVWSGCSTADGSRIASGGAPTRRQLRGAGCNERVGTGPDVRAPYEITGWLGSGAMGEVYRARDTRLNRDVALKLLPELLALEGDRLARFMREAQILASLNHPNIATLYGLEQAGGRHALVLEPIEGPTLADRIQRGPLPCDEVLSIARQ